MVFVVFIFIVGFVLGCVYCRFVRDRRVLVRVGSVGSVSSAMKMVFLIRTDLGMTNGKVAAQCCHAVLKAYLQAQKDTPQYLQAWENNGETKITLKCPNEQTLLKLATHAANLGLVATYVRDAGR
jgi:PTH2 family peptidyl-tRNA hydrolase